MSHNGMEGLHNFSQPQGSPPSLWETQYQLWLATLEDMVWSMKQTLEYLALFTAPTPSTTPLPFMLPCHTSL